MLEADLRDAITDANDLGHFFLLMEHKGYEIHHGNRLGFRLRGQERYMYPERKNAAFSEENIERAIAGNLTEIEAGIRPAFIQRPKPQPYRPHPKYKGIPCSLLSLLLSAWTHRKAAIPAAHDAASPTGDHESRNL